MKQASTYHLICIAFIVIGVVGFTACSSTSDSKDTDPAVPAAAGPDHPAEAADAISPASVYQLQSVWQDQHGDSMMLASLQGKIPVVAMTFTSCEFACPMIVADIKAVQDALPEKVRKQAVFVLASFDTARDTPEKLAEYAKQMKLDSNWILLHGNENEVRTLSMLLNIKYKKQDNGNFAHSNVITVLDKKGEVALRTEGLNVDIQPIVSKVTDLSNS